MAVGPSNRLYRGSRLRDAFPVPLPFPSLASLDSAFQLQEYIALLIRLDVHDVSRIVSIPGKKEGAPPSPNDGASANAEDDKAVVDEGCWIYEQLRRIAQDLSHPLLSTLQLECNRGTCPEMKAGEWLYLCVAHGTGATMEQCCAIDYIVHTLDGATALLNSPKAFPSRLSVPNASRRHFLSLARRLSRIFAHAYHHHREAFEECEAESSLYTRFYQLSRQFDLVPIEFLVPVSSPIHLTSRSPSDSDSDSDFSRGSRESPKVENGENPLSREQPILGRQRTDTMYSTSESLEAAVHSPEKQKADEDEDDYDLVEQPFTHPSTFPQPTPPMVPSPGTIILERAPSPIPHARDMAEIPDDSIPGSGHHDDDDDEDEDDEDEDDEDDEDEDELHLNDRSEEEIAASLRLATSLSPPTSPASPRRSPQRKDTLRQSDVSPLLQSIELPEESPAEQHHDSELEPEPLSEVESSELSTEITATPTPVTPEPESSDTSAIESPNHILDQDVHAKGKEAALSDMTDLVDQIATAVAVSNIASAAVQSPVKTTEGALEEEEGSEGVSVPEKTEDITDEAKEDKGAGEDLESVLDAATKSPLIPPRVVEETPPSEGEEDL